MAATRGTTTCMLSNYEELVKTLDNIAGVDAEKVIKKCTSDAKSRAQAWVSAAVCEVYAIKKADVKAALDGKGKGGGQLKVEGNLVESVVLTYKGRVLTPTHFKMKPTQRKPKPYRVSQEVFKGQRKNLPAGVFLASSGGEGSTQIPFQRESESRYPIKSIKTWARLDDVIDHVYRFKNGKGLKVSFTCVDSGGHFTQEVYAECKARQNKRVLSLDGYRMLSKRTAPPHRRAARLLSEHSHRPRSRVSVQKSDPLRKTSSPTPRTACRSLSEVMSTCSSTD